MSQTERAELQAELVRVENEERRHKNELDWLAKRKQTLKKQIKELR